MRTPSRATLIGFVVIGACLLVAALVAAAVIAGLGQVGKRLFLKKRLARVRRFTKWRAQYRLRGGLTRAYNPETQAIDMHPFVTRLADGETIVPTPRDPFRPPAADLLWGDAMTQAQTRSEAVYGAGVTVELKPGLVLAKSSSLSSSPINFPTTCTIKGTTCPNGGECSHWDGNDSDSGLVCCPSGKRETCVATASQYCTQQPDGNACSSHLCGGQCASGVCNSLGFCGTNEAVTSNVVVTGCMPFMFESAAVFQAYVQGNTDASYWENFGFHYSQVVETGIAATGIYEAWTAMAFYPPLSIMPGEGFGEPTTVTYGSAADVVAVGLDLLAISVYAFWNEGKEYMVDATLNPCQFSMGVGGSCDSTTWNLIRPYTYLPMYTMLMTTPDVTGNSSRIGTTWVTQGHSYQFSEAPFRVSNIGISTTWQLSDTTPLYQFNAAPGIAVPQTITNNSSITVYAAFMQENYVDALVLERGLNPKLIDPMPVMSTSSIGGSNDGAGWTFLTITPGETTDVLQTFGFISTAPMMFFVNPTETGGQARFSAMYDGVNEVVTFVPDANGPPGVNVMPVTFCGDYVNGFCVFDYAASLGGSPNYTTPQLITNEEFTQPLTPGVNTTATYEVYNFSNIVTGFIGIITPTQLSVTIVNEMTESGTLNQNGTPLYGGQIFPPRSVTTLTNYDAITGGATLDFGGEPWTQTTVPPTPNLFYFDTIIIRRGLPITFATQTVAANAPVVTYLSPLTMNPAVPCGSDYWFEGALVAFVNSTPDAIGGALCFGTTTLPDPTSFTSITMPNNGGPLVFSRIPPLTSPMPPATSLANISQFPWPTPYVAPAYTLETMPSEFEYTIVNNIECCSDIVPVTNVVNNSGTCMNQNGFINGATANPVCLPPGTSTQTFSYNQQYITPGQVITSMDNTEACVGGWGQFPANLNSFSTITIGSYITFS